VDHLVDQGSSEEIVHWEIGNRCHFCDLLDSLGPLPKSSGHPLHIRSNQVPSLHIFPHSYFVPHCNMMYPVIVF
jgi:hypothetical protein